MTTPATHMKAPSNVRGEALIEGQAYQIPASGVIKLTSESHAATLRRHGFRDHFEEPEDFAAAIEAMSDKDELVEFIEERAGDADNSMSMKKLKKLAREAAGVKE